MNCLGLPPTAMSPTSGIATGLGGRHQIDLLHLQAKDHRKLGLGICNNEVAQGDFPARLRECAPPSGQSEYTTSMGASAPSSELLLTALSVLCSPTTGPYPPPTTECVRGSAVMQRFGSSSFQASQPPTIFLACQSHCFLSDSCVRISTQDFYLVAVLDDLVELIPPHGLIWLLVLPEQHVPHDSRHQLLPLLDAPQVLL